MNIIEKIIETFSIYGEYGTKEKELKEDSFHKKYPFGTSLSNDEKIIYRQDLAAFQLKRENAGKVAKEKIQAVLKGLIIEVPCHTDGFNAIDNIKINGLEIPKMTNHNKEGMALHEFKMFIVPSSSKILNQGTYTLNNEGKLPYDSNTIEITGWNEREYFLAEIKR